MAASKSILNGEPVTLFSPVLAKAFGRCGALLLQQIYYCVSVRPNCPDAGGGFSWHFNTYDAWAEQLGYSAREIRRTIKNLANMKVIFVGVFNRHKYDRTRWYRVDCVGLCRALEILLGGTWQIRPESSGQNGQLHVARMSAPIPETPTENHTESKTCELALAAQQAQESQTKPAGEEQEKKNAGAEKLLKTAAKPTFALEEHWYSRMAVISGGKDHKPFTQKERGQLKMLANAVGADVRDVIDFAINHWQKFGQKARLTAGFPQYPTVPNVGFLLAHHQVARGMLLQSIAGNDTTAPVSPITPIAAPSVQALSKPKEEPAKLSDEELAVFLAELEAKK